MKTGHFNSSRKKLRISTVLIVLATMWCLANETATITVTRGPQQEFMGMGQQLNMWLSYGQYEQPVLDSIVKILYGDFKYQWLQLGLREMNERSYTSHYNGFKPYYDAVHAAYPDVELNFGAHGGWYDTADLDKGLQTYVDSNVLWMKRFRDAGIPFTSTTINSEPNQSRKKINYPAPFNKLMKMMRAGLDSQGLNDTKLLAPSCSNVDDKAFRLTNGIIADSAAFAMTDVFSTHSYTMAMTKAYRDLIWKYLQPPYNKLLWQDEGGRMVYPSTDTIQDSYKEQSGATFFAANSAGRFLCDLNLGSNYWCGISGWPKFEFKYTEGPDPKVIGTGSTLFRVRMKSETEAEVARHLNCYYYQQLTRAFLPGTRVRLCYSDLKPWSGSDTTRYRWMEWTYGTRPQVMAAAGLNASGKWVMGVLNITAMGWHRDTTKNDDGSKNVMFRYAPRADYDVTFDVEELTGSGASQFTVYRSSGTQFCKKSETVTMQNGKVTVTVKPRELVTLESVDSLEVAVVTDNIHGEVSPMTMRTSNRNGGLRIELANVNHEYHSMGMYSLDGRCIVSAPRDRLVRSGTNIAWDVDDNLKLSRGLYLIKLSGENNRQYEGKIVIP